MTKRYSGLGSGVDEVPRFQNRELTEIPDDVVDVEDHVTRRAILSGNAVHTELQNEILRFFNLVSSDEPRTEWIQRLTTLALVPLATTFQLEFSLGDNQYPAMASRVLLGDTR